MLPPVYDLCIVGAGMVGSAAARHASSTTDQRTRVCLVGPEEPQVKSSAATFAAHYDESRIVRGSDPDPFWAHVAQTSIARYHRLEKESGIPFYEERGCLTLGPDKGDPDFMRSVTESASALPGSTILKADQARSVFPYLGIDPEHTLAVLETTRSGYMNPRRFVQAQKILARKQGCDIIDDVVDHVTKADQSREDIFTVRCVSGREIQSRRVLLCTGVYGKNALLYPDGQLPDLSLTTQIVLHVEVPDAMVNDFRDMPSILYRDPVNERHSPNNRRCYVLPLIKYPDGKHYIKIGHGHQFEAPLMSQMELLDWFRREPPVGYREGLLRLFRSVFPGLPLDHVTFDTCVTDVTPSRRPYLDLIGPNFGVALGMNGYGAKSSDELGRIASRLVLDNVWDCDFPREEFRMKHSVSSKL